MAGPDDVAESAIAQCKLLGSKGEKLACLKKALTTVLTGGVSNALAQRQVKSLELAIVATESDLA